MPIKCDQFSIVILLRCKRDVIEQNAFRMPYMVAKRNCSWWKEFEFQSPFKYDNVVLTLVTLNVEKCKKVKRLLVECRNLIFL